MSAHHRRSSTARQAYQTHYKWACGLTVRDWRFVVRICNIDVTKLGEAQGPDLINLLIQAVHKPPVVPRAVANVQSATEARGGVQLEIPSTTSRYLRLNYVVGTGPLTAGKVHASLSVDRDNVRYYAKNYEA